MASPKRSAAAVFGVGNTLQVYQPYTNIVARLKGYNCALYSYQTPMASMCQLGARAESGISTSLLMQHMLAMGFHAAKSTEL